MEKETIVLYASTRAGHLAPMVLLAKQFTQQGFSVTILTTDQGHQITIPTNNNSLSFHTLPAVSCPGSENKHPIIRNYKIIRAYNPKLKEFLTTRSATATICAVVLDFFFTDAIGVARELNIPVYVLMTTGASTLAVFLHLPHLPNPSKKSFKDMGDHVSLNFPGVPSIPASDMPLSDHDLESETYKCYLNNKRKFIEADGILVNTFEALEPRAVAALRDGSCVPSHRTPPVYCIGPLVTGQDNKQQERHDCVVWLDSQPKRSVVFLCFGSAGAFSPSQIKQIAIGLENSGQRFLWVVCSRDDPKNIFAPRRDPDLDSFLPDGFLSRTEDRGMVVKLWAPQIEVLNHPSVGGFVSHCGWNSTLESIQAGVPMVCWPLYAEQGLNKVLLVEEMKVGVVMNGYNNGELVGSDEIEAKVRCLMESEDGEAMRKRVKGFKEKFLEAVAERGPLDQELEALLKDVMKAKEKITA